MGLEIPKQRYSGKVVQTMFGADREHGGTRGKTYVIGGSDSLPFHAFESERIVTPLIGMEVVDTLRGIDDVSKASMGDIIEDPVRWARTCENEWNADFINVKLKSANPEEENRSPEECASLVSEILKATTLPLVIYGCGSAEKDAKVIDAVSQAAAKERVFLGPADQDNYKTIAAAALSNGHGVIGFANLDINIAKQIVILLMDFGVRREDIMVDPLQAALGMGIEYTYSTLERLRNGALMGDQSLQVPMICDCSVAFTAREAIEMNPDMGDTLERAINWETITAHTSLLAGVDLIVVRHPESLKRVKKILSSLTGGA